MAQSPNSAISCEASQAKYTNPTFIGKFHLVQKWNLLVFIENRQNHHFPWHQHHSCFNKTLLQSMNHPVISVFSICSRETMLNVHLHILSTFKVHIGKPKFRPLMGVKPSFSPPTSFRTKHVHVKSVFLSATYSLLDWRVWI